MKLNMIGNSISWSFMMNGDFAGKIYQKAMIDFFQSTRDSTYYRSKNGFSDNPNFEVTVNNEIVDLSPYRNMTFEEMTRDGESSEAYGSDFSPIGLCPLGEVNLKAGQNVITYTRLDSYTMLVSKIVLIGK